MFPERIETERLELRRISPETIDPLDYYEVCSDETMEEVTRYLPWDPHPHPGESRDFLERTAGAWEDRERADYSGSEAKAHPFRGGMKPTTGDQTTGVGPPDIPTF